MRLVQGILLFSSLTFSSVPGSAQKLANKVYGIQGDTGTDRRIDAIIAGGPADRAGLKAGDKVLMIDQTSTEGMANLKIIKEISYTDETELSIERDGVQKRIHIVKEAAGAFGRTCISGNCVNGKGRTRLPKWDNREYEGTFQHGSIKGTGKIYDASGFLLYEGEIAGMVPWGKGKRYNKDASGRAYRSEEGYFESALRKGEQYAPDGTLRAQGEYINYDGEARLMVGSMALSYRGKQAVAEITHVEWKNGEPEYHGRVTISEGSVGNPGRRLSKTYYRIGKRDGDVFEWDYDNGLLHVIQYKEGKRQDEWWNGGKIINLADSTYVAISVVYAAGTSPEGDMLSRIVSGNFRFGGGYKALTGPSTGAPISTFKSLYATTPAPSPSSTSYAAGSNSTSGGNSSKYEAEVVSACDETLSDIVDRFKQAAYYYNNADLDKGYKASRANYTQIQQEVIASCDQALSTYRGRVPSDRIALLQEIRNELSSHNLGSGLLMSVPVMRNIDK